jgi:hypothetical protein
MGEIVNKKGLMMKKSCLVALVTVTFILNLFPVSKKSFVSSFEGTTLYAEADLMSDRLADIAYHEAVILLYQEAIDGFAKVSYGGNEGWIKKDDLKEKLETNVKEVETFFKKPFAKIDLPDIMEKKSYVQYVIKHFGKPSKQTVEQIKNKYDENQIDLVYTLSYEGCYEFRIYHISSEEMKNREVIEIMSIYTDKNRLNAGVIMVMSKDEVFKKFGYPTYIKDGSFKYNAVDYWGANIYFDFKDGKLSDVMITHLLD